jgi:hypothetical protein
VGACLAIVGAFASEEKKPARVYTNEDLERVRPYRDQTGVENTPVNPETKPERAGTLRQDLGRAAGRDGRSAEEHWRRSAEKLRAKLQPARDQADDLRLQIEERRRQPGVRPYTDRRILAAERKLAVLERRIRDAESNFEDRARQAGALPGWLR